MEVFKKIAILKLFIIFINAVTCDDTEPSIPEETCSDSLHTYLRNIVDGKFISAISEIQAKCLVTVQDELLVSTALNNIIEAKVTSKVNEVLAPILAQLQTTKTELTQAVTSKLSEVDMKLQDVDTKMEVRPKIEDMEQVQVLKELGKIKPLRNCQELQDQGISTPGTYFIDADGDGIGQKPFPVQCDFDGNASTIIKHDLSPEALVMSNAEIGLEYLIPSEQIQALIEQSEECYQEVTFNCLNTPLINGDQSMAQIKNGRDYWSSLEDEICEVECGIMCFRKTITCNCDSLESYWQSDQKRVSRQSLLPITGFRYQRLSSNSFANVTIGPLVCSGQPQSTKKVAFAAVRTRGDLSSGPGGVILTYDTLTANIGHGMDPDSGTFKAPVKGLYKFTVSLGGRDRGGPERLLVRKNGDHEFDVMGRSFSWMFSLEQDDTVTLLNEARLRVGTFRNGPEDRVSHIYFTGQLI